MHAHRKLHSLWRIHRHFEAHPDQAKNISSLVSFTTDLTPNLMFMGFRKESWFWLQGNFVVNSNQVFSICGLVFLCLENAKVGKLICSYSSFNMLYWLHFMDEETDPVTKDREVENDGPRKKVCIFWYGPITFSPPTCHIEPKYCF